MFLDSCTEVVLDGCTEVVLDGYTEVVLDGCTEVVLDGLGWFACRLFKMVVDGLGHGYMKVGNPS